jgi:folate-binding protein YgfZ
MRALAEVLVEEQGAWLVIGAGDGGAVRQSLDRVLFPADQVHLGALEHALWLQPAVPGANAAGPGRWRPAEGDVGWWLGESLVLRAGRAMPPEWEERPAAAPEERERWRMQRGWPAAPMEINDSTNPFELGLADRVSLDKGCYVGQETLAKLATYDGVKQQLRRWHCPAAAPPREESPPLPEGTILQDETGDRAGTITSSLDLGAAGCIGLAMVRRGWLSRPSLQVGEGPAARQVNLSVPEDFRAPPGAPGSGAGPGGTG